VLRLQGLFFLFAAATLLLAEAAAESSSNFTSSACWSEEFSFSRCCLARYPPADCWSGSYNYNNCCLTHPVLSSADLGALTRVHEESFWSCGCNEPIVLGGKEWSWCNARRAVMLGWELGNWYPHFVYLDVTGLAECLVGTFIFMVSHMFSKLNEGTPIESIPSYLWADEFLTILLQEGRSSDWLKSWTESGWNPFLILSHARQRVGGGMGGAGPTCSKDGSDTFLRHAADAVIGGPPVPIATAATFLADLTFARSCKASPAAEAGATSDAKTGVAERDDWDCCLALALGYATLRDSLLVDNSHHSEQEPLLNATADAVVAAISTRRAALGWRYGGLRLLLQSRWPFVDMMDRMFQHPSVKLPLASGLQRFLLQEPRGALKEPHSLWMRIFPRREIVSDMIRYVRTPFCGMRPFMRLIENIAFKGYGAEHAASSALSFVEGGPHLGDCTLWAAAVLEAAKVPFFAVAYEPLPDASALFRESVLDNKWDGQVVVVPKALGATEGEKVRLAYFPGHNGEGTTVRAAAQAHCGEGCEGFSEIDTATLDGTWEDYRPSHLDVLKLSVNGEELNTLRGARSLLSRRKICSALVHVTKAQRGWETAPKAEQGVGKKAGSFSSDLWNLLTNVAGFEVALHLDQDVTGQVRPEDTRPRPSTTVLKNADELEAVFSGQAYSHDYLVARQRRFEQTEQCKQSWAMRQWEEIF